MPVKPQSVHFMEVVEDLELLCVKEKQFTSMETAKEVREERVADLRKSSGTLEMVSSYWSIEVKHTYLIKKEDMQNYNYIYIPSN